MRKRRIEFKEDIKRARLFANKPPQVETTLIKTSGRGRRIRRRFGIIAIVDRIPTKLQLDEVIQQLQTVELVLNEHTIAVERLKKDGNDCGRAREGRQRRGRRFGAHHQARHVFGLFAQRSQEFGHVVVVVAEEFVRLDELRLALEPRESRAVLVRC